MKFILIDSTGQELFVALVSEKDIEVRIFKEQRAHDRNLNKLTHDWIDKANAFAVVTGPGSWTGSRVGVVATKAYALATGKMVIALTANENRDILIAEAKQKYKNKEFINVRELSPTYDSEFKVTLKKGSND